MWGGGGRLYSLLCKRRPKGKIEEALRLSTCRAGKENERTILNKVLEIMCRPLGMGIGDSLPRKMKKGPTSRLRRGGKEGSLLEDIVQKAKGRSRQKIGGRLCGG